MKILSVIEESRSHGEICDQIQDLVAAEPYEGWFEDIESQCERSGSFTLCELETEGLGGHVAGVDREKLARYRKLRSAAPPIVFCSTYGCPDPEPTLLDGMHRLALAIERGDRTILAWVPSEFADEQLAAG